MKTLSERIEKILSDKDGLDQIGLARIAGASKSVVNQWIDGKIKSMRLDYALNIERALGYSHVWLVLGDGPIMPESKEWPFTTSLDVYMALPAPDRTEVDNFLSYTVEKWQKANHIKSKKSA